MDRGTIKNILRPLLVCAVGIAGLSGCGGGGSLALKSTAPVQAPITASSVPSVSNAAAPAAASSPSGCSVTSYLPNFAQETDPVTNLPNQLYHWSAFPARVYFMPSTFLTPDRKAQVWAGFDWWRVATGFAVRYEEVAAAASANVVVQFETQGKTDYGAVTEYHVDGNRQLQDATITFNMTYLADIASLTPVAAHEFGHALGIGGHSNDHQDVMSSSPGVYQLTSLTPRDINTLETAYCGLPVTSSTPGATTSGITKGVGKVIMVHCGFHAK